MYIQKIWKIYADDIENYETQSIKTYSARTSEFHACANNALSTVRWRRACCRGSQLFHSNSSLAKSTAISCLFLHCPADLQDPLKTSITNRFKIKNCNWITSILKTWYRPSLPIPHWSSSKLSASRSISWVSTVKHQKPPDRIHTAHGGPSCTRFFY